ncbi:MAG TPA: hypothetical protein VGN63_20380 [Flavisolibacter sp.]|jgi:hypothetical protein|nr:hypothetical protein [Flavisolibacter sp.]
MEKNQQNQTRENLSSNEGSTTGGAQPGQQLPTKDPSSLDQPKVRSGEIDQHSESSLPEKDEETLGTP